MSDRHSSPADTVIGSTIISDLMQEDIVDPYRCPHITIAFSDQVEKARLSKKIKSLGTWNARRAHEAIHPAKQRKV